jgi:hypothetical protein
MCGVALIQSRSGRLIEEAQRRAREQMGSDFSDYKFFVRNIRQTFRPGEFMRVKAEIIAYQPKLGSGALEEVTVEWKEPWR